MAIIINGRVLGNVSGNVRIVNGRVISGDSCDDITSKDFDEIKKESASGIDRITIDSNINVKVSASDTNEVTAHLHGSAITNNTYKLYMKRFNKEIHISVNPEESSMSVISGVSISSSTIIVGGDGLVLDVQIPTRAFELLSVESINANIDVTSFVNANTITVNNKNGNIDVTAMFKSLNIDCKNGNIDVDSEAQSDINFNITCKNGNIDVIIENIGASTVFVDSKNGHCRNTPHLKGIYSASGSITSKNGNVKFR